VADTIVSAPNQKHIEVQYVDTDSSYSVISYWTDDNGRPLYMKSRQNFVRQIKQGPEKHWALNGQLIYTALWVKGTPMGSVMEYYDNGQKAFEGEYQVGTPVEKHKYWYRNGNVRMRGKYEGGELSGRWEYFDEIGTLELTIEYEAGLAVRINGQKIKLPKPKEDQ
jgi:antitoxin component YwqK of YwqJK toxin-antitoxin module